MYNVVIVGGGICGLNLACLLKEKNIKNVCLLEKSNRLGGLIKTNYVNLEINKGEKRKVKYEAGGAVVFEYQKNMKDLIQKYNMETMILPIDKKGHHYKNYYDGKERKRVLSTETTEKFLKLLKKVFDYIEKKGEDYCRKMTLEQICLEVVSYDDTRFMEFCYGYASEFRIANAVVAKKNIENEMFNTKEMYIFKEGYSKLLEKMYEQVKDNYEIKTKTEVKDFVDENGIIKLKLKSGNIIEAKKVVFCIPKEGLLKLCDSFNEKEQELFNSVNSSSLTRIFTKYNIEKKDNMWMKKINFSTVANPIRQIIPIKQVLGKNIGLFQISYSDSNHADYWGRLNLENTKKVLKKLLEETFHNKKIDNPEWIKKIYWKNAIHFWKPNVNEKTLYKRIMKLRPNILIGGESFSLNQGWCEGAVQTSIDLSKLIK
jgi:protoporphyrinogen oxidase